MRAEALDEGGAHDGQARHDGALRPGRHGVLADELHEEVELRTGALLPRSGLRQERAWRSVNRCLPLNGRPHGATST
jgi:hypothetical protein